MSKTKQDLIDFISQTADISKVEADNAVNAYHDFVTSTLESGDKLTIVGYGSYETSHRAARIGRNPQTREEIQIPAATVPKFKPGKKLKDAVNK